MALSGSPGAECARSRGGGATTRHAPDRPRPGSPSVAGLDLRRSGQRSVDHVSLSICRSASCGPSPSVYVTWTLDFCPHQKRDQLPMVAKLSSRPCEHPSCRDPWPSARRCRRSMRPCPSTIDAVELLSGERAPRSCARGRSRRASSTTAPGRHRRRDPRGRRDGRRPWRRSAPPRWGTRPATFGNVMRR